MVMYKNAVTEDVVVAEEMDANVDKAICGLCCVR